MKPFSFELASVFVSCSQLQQLDLNLPYGFEINGDRELRFDFKLELLYEHLQQFPELLKLFRERSNVYKCLRYASIDKDLIPLTKLVGNWENPVFEKAYNRTTFSGGIPYNPHNLEVFLEYFRN